MTRCLLPVVLMAAWLAAAPAFAAGHGKKEDEGKPKSAVELSPIAMPIVVDGAIVNYVFVTFKLTPTDKADVPALQSKQPLLRDGMVRAAHRTPFTRPDNHNLVDEGRAIAALTAFAPSVVGKGQIQTIAISHQQAKNLLRAPRPKK